MPYSYLIFGQQRSLVVIYIYSIQWYVWVMKKRKEILIIARHLREWKSNLHLFDSTHTLEANYFFYLLFRIKFKIVKYAIYPTAYNHNR